MLCGDMDSIAASLNLIKRSPTGAIDSFCPELGLQSLANRLLVFENIATMVILDLHDGNLEK